MGEAICYDPTVSRAVREGKIAGKASARNEMLKPRRRGSRYACEALLSLGEIVQRASNVCGTHHEEMH